MYTEKELAAIAKRENNTKRKYLVVNRFQGKHIPVRPGDAFSMFGELADLLEARYKGESLLLVGFAETATAIGAAAAVKMDSYYIQTTRENIPGVSYLYFSETHSHATEQKLVKNDLDDILSKITRVVFVEDEVTTGNTILHIINLMQKTYGHNVKFSVASLLNGMNPQSQEIYREREIDTLYLVKTDHDTYTEIAEQYAGDGIYHKKNTKEQEVKVNTISASNYVNARRLQKGSSYAAACEKLWQEVEKKAPVGTHKRILVLGTEEFMYPALYVAQQMEKKENTVVCHSTTRSPIAVSSEPEYPLHERYELASLYDDSRTTYIYDLASYDEVFIITDADSGKTDGFNSLLNALYSCGNDRIHVIRWS